VSAKGTFEQDQVEGNQRRQKQEHGHAELNNGDIESGRGHDRS